jgi:hypothetical protein
MQDLVKQHRSLEAALEVLAGEENSKPVAASSASRESIVSTRP